MSLGVSGVIKRMRAGNVLMRTFTPLSPEGVVHHLEPCGDYVHPHIASQVKRQRAIIANDDGLFGIDQSWRFEDRDAEVALDQSSRAAQRT